MVRNEHRELLSSIQQLNVSIQQLNATTQQLNVTIQQLSATTQQLDINTGIMIKALQEHLTENKALKDRVIAWQQNEIHQLQYSNLQYQELLNWVNVNGGPPPPNQ